MGDFDAAFRHLLSCSLCGTYYGYSDLVVACEQADAAALERAAALMYAERPRLWATRCGLCDQELPWRRVAEHRRFWSQGRVKAPAPLCERCCRFLPTLIEMRVEVAVLIKEIEDGGQGGERR